MSLGKGGRRYVILVYVREGEDMLYMSLGNEEGRYAVHIFR